MASRPDARTKCLDKLPDQIGLLARAVADANSHNGFAVRLLAPARLLALIVRSTITPSSHNGFAERLYIVMVELLPSYERGMSAL